MSASSITAQAHGDPQWRAAWQQLDPWLRAGLQRHGLDDPVTWGGLLKGATDERAQLTVIFRSLGLLDNGPESVTDTLDAGMALHSAALSAAQAWVDRMARRSALQCEVDYEMGRKRNLQEENEKDQLRRSFPQVQALPAVWRGKAYRRVEEEGDERARERADGRERSKWGTRLVSLVVESCLPFGREITERQLPHDGAEAFRCLRGMRWTSVKKRVSDWAPVRRFLLAEYSVTFPRVAREFIEYIEIRIKEDAAVTTFGAALGALRFLEEAGEVPAAERISTEAAITNAVKEAEKRVHTVKSAFGTGRGRQ